MDERVLQIVLRARNEASKVIKEAVNDVESFGDTFKKNIGTAGIMAGGLVGSLGILSKSFIDNASAMEQNRIAFTTMFQSGEVAGKILRDLSNFAATTPFDLPQVVEGAKRLAAYGIEANNIIPTFKMLGDISAGVGTDKLPQLILAFGQVRAATKLTGMELRQFSEAGVPLLGALVNQANAAGGVLTKVGGLSEKEAKRMGTLTTQLVDQEYRFKLLKDAGKDTGVGFKMLEKKITDNKSALEKYGAVGQATYTRVKVTAQDMIEKISDGSVKFEEVQKALMAMTQEGGQFFDLMGKQSLTFSGRLSNIRDEFVRFSLAVMGFTAEGEIRQGSLFYYLKLGAESALTTIQKLRPVVAQFTDNFLKNQGAVSSAIGGLIGLFVLMGVAFLGAFGPAIVVMTTFAVIGAGVGFVLNDIVNKFGGWNVVLGMLNTAGQQVIAWVNQHKDQLTTLAGIIGVSLIPKLALLSLKMGTDFVLSVVKSTIGVIGWIAEGWRAIAMLTIKIVQLSIATAAFLLHTAVTVGAAIATGTLTAATWLLNIALAVLTSPITLVILAIVGLIAIGVLLWKNWDTVKAKATEVWTSVSGAWNGLWANVGKAVDGMMAKVDEWKKGIQSAVDSVLGFFKRMADGVTNALKAIKFPHLSISEGSSNVLGKDVKYPKLNVDWYEKGGWVPRTGLAVVHEGEYVLSRDMIAGRQASPAVAGGASISLGPIYVAEREDVDTMAQRLSFYLKTAGDL